MNCWDKLRSLYVYKHKFHPRHSSEHIFVVILMLTLRLILNNLNAFYRCYYRIVVSSSSRYMHVWVPAANT